MGKGVIDTGCARFLIGQHTLEKCEYGVLRVHVVPGGASLLLSKEFLSYLVCHIDLDVVICPLRNWECELR